MIILSAFGSTRFLMVIFFLGTYIAIAIVKKVKVVDLSSASRRTVKGYHCFTCTPCV